MGCLSSKNEELILAPPKDEVPPDEERNNNTETLASLELPLGPRRRAFSIVSLLDVSTLDVEEEEVPNPVSLVSESLEHLVDEHGLLRKSVRRTLSSVSNCSVRKPLESEAAADISLVLLDDETGEGIGIKCMIGEGGESRN